MTTYTFPETLELEGALFAPTSTVAAAMGYTPQHVRTLIRAGSVPGTTWNGRYLIPVAWLDALQAKADGSLRDWAEAYLAGGDDR